MPNTISSFSGTYGFLSNFYLATVVLDEIEYPTVEHAFQAAKTLAPVQREQIRLATTMNAKRLGRRVALRSGWDGMRVEVMRGLVQQKFTRHPELARRLLATEDARLIEGNYWRDRFWGVFEGEGENQLGLILEQVRENLKKAA